MPIITHPTPGTQHEAQGEPIGPARSSGPLYVVFVPLRLKPRECRESYKLLNLPKQVGAALVARVNPGENADIQFGRQTLAPGTEVLAQSFQGQHAHRRADGPYLPR